MEQMLALTNLIMQKSRLINIGRVKSTEEIKFNFQITNAKDYKK